MSQDEFETWIEYYKHWPWDDLHRYHRPAALIGSSMSGDYEAKLKFLSPPPTVLDTSTLSQADLTTIETMRKFGIPMKPRNSNGGR